MSQVLILYPRLFNCYNKFYRKVAKIISHLDQVELLYPSDTNGFIKQFALTKPTKIKLIANVNWQLADISHAIIFDDGEEFPSQLAEFKAAAVPYRLIKISLSRVVNLKREAQYQGLADSDSYQYIGRGSYWGNPYSQYEGVDSREEVIRKYRYDFENDCFANKNKAEVYKLLGKRLACFCKPEACHGDILAGFLNSWDDCL